MSAYYNENDPKAAAWLRELMKHGHIPAGHIDTRSIEDVRPGELKGFTQCHFFAGIGGWAYALKLAGWPDDRPVWTGSCPCQPFSVANSRRKVTDARHLYPVWSRLIEECEPAVVFGEQVSSPLGFAWLDSVCADLEAKGYAVGAADLCAAGVGAPHIRQRLYWVAVGDSSREGSGRNARAVPRAQTSAAWEVWDLTHESIAASVDRRIVADAHREGSQGRRERGIGTDQRLAGAPSAARGVADTNGGSESDGELQRGGQHGVEQEDRRSPWSGCRWVACTDGKARPVEPGSFPLAHGIPGRVGLLRGYGNAIVPQVAAAFIEAAGVM